MDTIVFTWPILLAAVLLVVGVYLHLEYHRSPRFHWTSIFFIVLSLAIFISSQQAAWWPPSRMQSVLISTIYIVFACISLTGIVTTLLSTNIQWSILGFLVAILSTLGFFLLAGLSIIPFAALLLYAAVVVVAIKYMMRLTDWQALFSQADHHHEPLLACVAGAFLIASLTAAIHVTLITKPKDETGQHVTAALPDSKIIQKSLDHNSEQKNTDAQKPQVTNLSQALFTDHSLAIGLFCLITFIAVKLSWLMLHESGIEPINVTQRNQHVEKSKPTENHH